MTNFIKNRRYKIENLNLFNDIVYDYFFTARENHNIFKLIDIQKDSESSTLYIFMNYSETITYNFSEYSDFNLLEKFKLFEMDELYNTKIGDEFIDQYKTTYKIVNNKLQHRDTTGIKNILNMDNLTLYTNKQLYELGFVLTKK